MSKRYYQKICMNGHQITDFYELSINPNPPEYCEKCGEEVIATCLKCSKPILGRYITGYSIGRVSPIPNYCRYCSSPYPWTELIINTTDELISLDEELNESDKTLIKDSIPDLLVDTPKTNLAVAKFKKGFASASGIVKDSLRELLVDVISETAKKTIFPG